MRTSRRRGFREILVRIMRRRRFLAQEEGMHTRTRSATGMIGTERKPRERKPRRCTPLLDDSGGGEDALGVRAAARGAATAAATAAAAAEAYAGMREGGW